MRRRSSGLVACWKRVAKLAPSCGHSSLGLAGAELIADAPSRPNAVRRIKGFSESRWSGDDDPRCGADAVGATGLARSSRTGSACVGIELGPGSEGWSDGLAPWVMAIAMEVMV